MEIYHQLHHSGTGQHYISRQGQDTRHHLSRIVCRHDLNFGLCRKKKPKKLRKNPPLQHKTKQIFFFKPGNFLANLLLETCSSVIRTKVKQKYVSSVHFFPLWAISPTGLDVAQLAPPNTFFRGKKIFSVKKLLQFQSIVTVSLSKMVFKHLVSSSYKRAYRVWCSRWAESEGSH